MSACSDHTHCIDKALREATTFCYEKGLRFTNLRQKILTMVWESHQPAKAYDLMERLRGDVFSAKPPTVYRTLDFLLEHGLIHRLSSLNAYVGCSHPHQCQACYFLICAECGAVQECCNKKLNNMLCATTKKHQFDMGYITLEISGICQDCREGN